MNQVQLSIALPKGRLGDSAVKLLIAAGLDINPDDFAGRQLIVESPDGDLRFLLAKPADVPTYVAAGVADIGVVGKDTLLEEGRDLYEVADLGFGACRLCLCGPASARPAEGESLRLQGARVATKYPVSTRRYFEDVRGESVEIIRLNGSVELAPLIGLSDVIVDIVESGRTLAENGLVVLETITELSARLVVNRVSMKMKAGRITPLLAAIRQSLAAPPEPAPVPEPEPEPGPPRPLIRRIDLRTGEAGEAGLARLLDDRRQQGVEGVAETVREILKTVAARGDAALAEYTRRFDGVDVAPAELEVPAAEIAAALEGLDPVLRADLEAAAARIRRFHEAQLETVHNTVLEEPGRHVALCARPLGVVGVYVPGGLAPLPSSVLMNVLPARAAGVDEIVMCTPPGADGRVAPVILAAAAIAGVDRLFRVGGAQAIAAMAYGSETVPAVDKIVGPGNLYVNEAKRQIYGVCDIDMLAGPSEILVIADGSQSPDFIAADLLSQAEHDPHASAVLLTDSEALIGEVALALERQTAASERSEIIARALGGQSALILVPDLESAYEIADRLAPEHLELLLEPEARERARARIRHAGAVFLGPWSPEPLGDYWSGANHVLPTGGSARFASPLNSRMFLKLTSCIEWDREALEADGPAIMRFAAAEGLDRHAAAVRLRLEEGGES
ncbi:MAG: histidinol dehydrogenase [Bacillota bacterium]|nr:histidinol dehydrogenase [Bacillota bacterium]